MPDAQPLHSIESFLKLDQERKTKRRAELIDFLKSVPVAEDVLKEVVWLWPTDFQAVSRHHPGHKIERKLQSLNSMLSIFYQSHADLIEHLDRFDAFSLSDEMHWPIGKQTLKAIETAINKELVAFSALAAALVEFSRRLKNVGISDLKSKRDEIFDREEHCFVIALRNVVSHQDFPDISWQITYAKKRTTDFILFADDLRCNAELNREALAFVDRCGEKIHVRALANGYASRVRCFYEWYKSMVEDHKPEALNDYRRIVQAHKATVSRSAHHLLLKHFLARKVDPYKHLHKFLPPDQVKVAVGLPNRSKAQVDYIIAVVDEHGACDEELRQLAYQLFEVGGQK